MEVLRCSVNDDAELKFRDFSTTDRSSDFCSQSPGDLVELQQCLGRIESIPRRERAHNDQQSTRIGSWNDFAYDQVFENIFVADTG
jgi:hypothetical protein